MPLRSPHDREIARLAVPAFGTLIAGPLYVLADTAIIGHIGTSELGGLALASTVLLSVHSLLIFLAYGTTASVSRLMGVGDETEAARVSVQALWLALLLGIAFAVFGYLGATPLLRALGGSGPALAAGETYLKISTFGLPFVLLTLASAGTFHGRQNTRTPLVVTLGGETTNIVLEVILIFGLGYGVGASALSTVIAQVATGLVFASRVVAWARSVGVSLTPNVEDLRRVLVAGQPLVIRNLALRGAFTVGTAVAARIGDIELAAHQIGLQVWSALALALDAVAIAGQALTGRWLGAGEAERAKEAARRMIQLDVAIGVFAAVAIIALRGPIASIFSSDRDVIAAAGFVLVWVAIAEPVNGYVFALDGILIGAGDLRYLGRSMALVSLAFMAMAVALLIAEAGLGWLWAALTVFMTLRAVAVWVRWRSDRWIVIGRSVP